MNVGIGNKAAQFHFSEYIIGLLVQCSVKGHEWQICLLIQLSCVYFWGHKFWGSWQPR
jgi:hypothetical protein